MNEHELTHYGILGMKWGRRRYQNKDGSLTTEGKKRKNSNAYQKKQAIKSTVKRTAQNAATLAVVGIYAHAVLKNSNAISRGKTYTNNYLKKNGHKTVKQLQEAKTWADYAWDEVNKI